MSTENQQSLNVVKFPGAIATLKAAWKIYKYRFLDFLKAAGIMIFLNAVILILLLLITELFRILSLPYNFGIIYHFAITVISVLIFILIFALYQMALINIAKTGDEKISALQFYKDSMSKIGSWLWINILWLIIVFGGLFLLGVPGLIFAIWFFGITFILVYENLTGMNALLKSKEYVKGRWFLVTWNIIAITFISGLITFVLRSIITLTLLFFETVVGLPVYVSNIITSKPTTLIIWLLVYPLTLTYLFLVYENLKKEKGKFVFETKTSTKILFIGAGIVGIIIAIFLFFFNTILNKSEINSLNQQETQVEAALQLEKAKHVADMKNIITALKLYYSDNNKLPQKLDELVPKYLPIIPGGTSAYWYELLSGEKDFKLCLSDGGWSSKCVSLQDTDITIDDIINYGYLKGLGN